MWKKHNINMLFLVNNLHIRDLHYMSLNETKSHTLKSMMINKRPSLNTRWSIKLQNSIYKT